MEKRPSNFFTKLSVQEEKILPTFAHLEVEVHPDSCRCGRKLRPIELQQKFGQYVRRVSKNPEVFKIKNKDKKEEKKKKRALKSH